MISYAQNYEDVILNRVFVNKTNGFYIDVGAADPVNLSVTYWFYCNNWKGINVEPEQFYFRKLQEKRPNDINLNVAVSNTFSNIPLFVVKYPSGEITGLSTLKEDYVNQLHNDEFIVEKQNIQTTTLAAICDEHLEGKTIDFLKIDVEGFEKQVLEGNNWKKYRPIVILVEATLPNSPQPSFEDWEYIILQNGYTFVYFDGLNRFYLEDTHLELKQRFIPPNVFDNFMRYEAIDLRTHLSHLKNTIHYLEDALLKRENDYSTLVSIIDKTHTLECGVREAALLELKATQISQDQNSVSVNIMLTNKSDKILASISALPNPVYISYHWLNNDTKQPVIYDGQRFPIDPPLPAGQAQCYTLNVDIPEQLDKVKSYTLYFTLVQEGVAWFEQYSKTAWDAFSISLLPKETLSQQFDQILEIENNWLENIGEKPINSENKIRIANFLLNYIISSNKTIDLSIRHFIEEKFLPSIKLEPFTKPYIFNKQQDKNYIDFLYDIIHQNTFYKYCIMLDITVFVMGQHNNKARTGVFVVTAKIFELLLEMHRKNLINLTVCVTQNKGIFPFAIQYYLLYLQQFGVSLYFEYVFPIVDIYHSTFYGLPNNLQQSKVRFLTLYDLIPLKLPQFFTDEYSVDKSRMSDTLRTLTNKDWILSISDYTSDDYRKYNPNFPIDRIHVVKLAADIEKFYPCKDENKIINIRENYRLSSNQYVLSVCTLEPRKNLDFVIRGFIRLLKEKSIPNLNLVLVGTKGWLYEHIFEEIENAPEYIERVIFTGYVPDEDMAALYSGALAFVYMSLYEGFGLPPLEAMQCGTPVITSNTSSLPEVVGDGGLMLDPTDLNAFCDALYEIYINPSHREELAQKALIRSKQFSWEKFAQQTIAAYELAMQTHYPNDIQPIPLEDKNLKAQRLTLIIDGIFFQLFKTGIARLWQALLQEWLQTPHIKQIVVLNRAGTMPEIQGVQYRKIPAYDYSKTDQDRQLLQDICNEEGADLFISTYYTTPISTPSVFMAYDMIPETQGFDLKMPSWREKHYGINHASGYIAISKNTALDLCKFFPHITSNEIQLAYPGVSEDFYPADEAEIANFRKKYNITKPFFFIPGKRDEYKNGILFFKAFSQLPNKSDFSIVCTRGNKIEAEFLPYLKGIDARVFNFTDDSELRCVYSSAVALVYPSKYEGFGLPIVEAMSCGCPIITTPISAITEVGEEAVLYVQPDSVEEMYQALLKIQQPEIRVNLKQKGFQRASLFSWTAMSNNIWSYLEQKKNSLPLNLPFFIFTKEVKGFFLEQNVEEAHQWLIDALSFNPTKTELINDLAVISFNQNQLEKATELFKQAFVSAPTNIELQKNIGYMFIYLKNYEQALQTFSIIIDANPTDIAIYDITIWLAAKLGYSEYKQKILALRKEKISTPKPTIPIQLSFSFSHPHCHQLHQTKQSEQAINLLKQMIQATEPTPYNLENDLGVFLLMNTDTRQEGLNYLIHAVKLKPNDMLALKNLVFAYIMFEDYRSALSKLEKLNKKTPNDIEICLALGFTYIQLKQLYKAKNILKKVLNIEPYNMVVKNLLTQLGNNNND